MPRVSKKKHSFICWHTRVDKTAACHGLVIWEAELEGLLYEVLSKQAQIILNLGNLSNSGRLDIQLTEQAEHESRIEARIFLATICRMDADAEITEQVPAFC